MKKFRLQATCMVLAISATMVMTQAHAQTVTTIVPPFANGSTSSECPRGATAILVTCSALDSVDPRTGEWSYDLSMKSRLQGNAPGQGYAWADTEISHPFTLNAWASEVNLRFRVHLSRLESSGESGPLNSGWRYLGINSAARHSKCGNCNAYAGLDLSDEPPLDPALGQDITIDLRMVNCGGGLIPPGDITLFLRSGATIGMGGLIPASGSQHVAIDGQLTSIEVSVDESFTPVTCESGSGGF